MAPLGLFALAAESAARTSSRPIPYLNRACGFSSTRTAGSELPPTLTFPTPGIWEIFWARIVEATSYSWPGLSVPEFISSTMIGSSAELDFRYVGLLRRAVGRSARAPLIAACTSRAAPSMSRLSPNCRLMFVLPTELCEVISVTLAICPSRRSSGVATELAIVSGLAPAMEALTPIVGKSTWGTGATGSFEKAMMPASAIPAERRIVATGLRMKGSEIFIRRRPPARHRCRRSGSGTGPQAGRNTGR